VLAPGRYLHRLATADRQTIAHARRARRLVLRSRIAWQRPRRLFFDKAATDDSQTVSSVCGSEPVGHRREERTDAFAARQAQDYVAVCRRQRNRGAPVVARRAA
jgi:hypothetical protein